MELTWYGPCVTMPAYVVSVFERTPGLFARESVT
jgi:hypothetical protein